MDRDKETCKQLYEESALIGQERLVIRKLFDCYQASDAHSGEKFLPGEVRFTGPTVRRAYIEKAVAEIVALIGGETIPKHTMRADRPNIPTSHYSFYRVGILGITISNVLDQKHLPRETDYRSSLIAGLNIPFALDIFESQDAEPDDSYLYLLLQHGRGEIDSAIPSYASFKAIDRQSGVVWTRNLFKYNAAFVREIIETINPEKESTNSEIVRLKQHLRQLETGTEE